MNVLSRAPHIICARSKAGEIDSDSLKITLNIGRRGVSLNHELKGKRFIVWPGQDHWLSAFYERETIFSGDRCRQSPSGTAESKTLDLAGVYLQDRLSFRVSVKSRIRTIMIMEFIYRCHALGLTAE